MRTLVRELGRSRRTALVIALTLALSSMGTGFFTLALLTSSTSVGSNTFTTGTIVIGTSPTSALIGFTGMLPGDSVTAALTVNNTGTGALRYAMTSASTNPDSKALRDQMSMIVRTKDTNTSGCTNFNGSQLYSGALSGALFGDPAVGSQTGDRSLNASASEVLCFQASLPIGTGNAFASATTTTTFTFQAEQTANN